jgi:ketosteroid isomerase-like protein
VEIARNGHAAFSRRDLDGFLSVWHPEAEYRAAITQAVEGESGVFRGHDGIRRWWRELDELYEDVSTEVLEARDFGERVFVAFVIHGRGKASGLITDQLLAQILTMREGKIVDVRDYLGREEALKAVGLEE